MTKLAAVLPALGVGVGGAAAGGLGASLLSGLAVSGAGMLANKYEQKRAYKKQENLNKQWVDFQHRAQANADEKENRLRDDAQTELYANLDDHSVENRQDLVDDEASRLETAFIEAGAPTATADDLLSGSASAGSHHKEYMGRALAEATKDARERMKSLAQVSSYGGTSGAMSNVLAEGNANTAQNLSLANLERGSNLNTLKRWQTLTPEVYEASPTGFGDLLMGVGSYMMGGGTGLGGGTANAPKTSPRPRPRPTGI
tara:strand:+ start:1259 stop:2032 length:774 start_codon:yes stop_codon:yes gene_type:complete